MLKYLSNSENRKCYQVNAFTEHLLDAHNINYMQLVVV